MKTLIKLIVTLCIFLLIITVTGCSAKSQYDSATDNMFEKIDNENKQKIKEKRAQRKTFLKKNISINVVEDGKYKLSFKELEVVDVFIPNDASVPQDDVEYAAINGHTRERYYFVVFNGTFKNLTSEDLKFRDDIQFQLSMGNKTLGAFYTRVIKSKNDEMLDRNIFETGEEKEVQFAVTMNPEDALNIIGQDMNLIINEKPNEIKIQ